MITTPINVSEAGDSTTGTGAFKVVKLDSAGKLPAVDGSQLTGVSFSKFGGTGVDGALNITTGTTTIDLGGSAYFIKNYTSVSISNGATLAFSNPNAKGTIIAIKSQGAVSILGTINAAGMGASSGNDGVGNVKSSKTSGGTVISISTTLAGKLIDLAPGSAGGAGLYNLGGGPIGGNGGNGGGCLYIEAASTYNFVTGGTINVSGTVGSNGGASQNFYVGVGGGGGGAGGQVYVLYGSSIISDTGTYTLSGGNGGIGGNGQNSGGTSGTGYAGGAGGSYEYLGGAGGAGGINVTGGTGSTGGGGGGTGGAGGVNGNSYGGGGGGGGGSIGKKVIVKNTEF